MMCEMVDDDTELAAVGKIFSELIEDADIEYESRHKCMVSESARMIQKMKQRDRNEKREPRCKQRTSNRKQNFKT